MECFSERITALVSGSLRDAIKRLGCLVGFAIARRLRDDVRQLARTEQHSCQSRAGDTLTEFFHRYSLVGLDLITELGLAHGRCSLREKNAMFAERTAAIVVAPVLSFGESESGHQGS